MNETDNDNKTKRCIFCNTLLIGRTDKMFCDDRCRNNYYYKVNSDQKEYIRKINKILLKNRGILRTVNPYGRTSVSKRYLESLGFDFNCFTSIHKTRKNRIYYLVYDQAYSIDPDGERVVLIVFYREAQTVVS